MSSPAQNSFATTRWSVVVAAGRRSSPTSRAALAELCQRYWGPLYVYVRRRFGDVHEARDLTQEFFARLLEKNSLALADPDRGRFRSFLVTSLKHFLANEWDKVKAKKRGGDCKTLSLDFDAADASLSREPAHSWTPERLYERQWALTLLHQVLEQLRTEYAAADKGALFEHLKPSLAGEAGGESYAAIARQLDITEGAVKAAGHRLRKRYRDLLRAEVAQTLTDEADVDAEIRGLFDALAP